MKENKILIFSTILILLLAILNKEYLRPNFRHIKYLHILIGSFSNFAGAFLFVNFFNGLIPKIYWKKELIYFTTSLTFILLTMEEFYPFLAGSKTFDVYDIIASGMGVVFAFYMWKYNQSKKLERKNHNPTDKAECRDNNQIMT